MFTFLYYSSFLHLIPWVLYSKFQDRLLLNYLNQLDRLLPSQLTSLSLHLSRHLQLQQEEQGR